MSSLDELPTFGAPMLEHFTFSPDKKNFNHGGWGAYPNVVRETIREFHGQFESHPDIFVRFSQPAALNEAQEAVAELCNTSSNNCVLIRNTTTGVATVLHNLDFSEGDLILYFSSTYGAFQKMITFLSEKTPVRSWKVEYELPIRHEDLIEKFVAAIKLIRSLNLNPRIAIFETVVSAPAFRFPFERLIEICKSEGIFSLIDGAHGLGQIHLDLHELQPDFFIAECHKWLYVPRSCAMLYVRPCHQHFIRSTVPTSWGYITSSGSQELLPWSTTQSGTNSKFQTLFKYVSTQDNTPSLCLPAAIRFRQECGGEARIYDYLETLANEGSDIVAETLDTEVLQEPGRKPGEPSQYRRCALATVRLPLAIDGHGCENTPYPPLQAAEVPEVINNLGNLLADDFGTWIPIFPLGGWLWARLSAQVYLEKKDFEWLATALKGLCERIGTRQVGSQTGSRAAF